MRILLGFLDGPGAVITASDAVVLAGTGLPMNRSLEILVAAGMAGEDRIPAIEAWFTKQTTRLPEPMVTELRRWFDVMLHGSRTPPRRRPRTQITTRLHLAWALLALSAARINIGFHQPQQPLPLDIRFVREALTSPGPARAAIVALVAFHGLRLGQIRDLQVTDARDGRLHVGGRAILLAGPARTPPGGLAGLPGSALAAHRQPAPVPHHALRAGRPPGL